jgi:hypothetical protein
MLQLALDVCLRDAFPDGLRVHLRVKIAVAALPL